MKVIYHGTDLSNSDILLEKLYHPVGLYIAVDVETISLNDKTIIGFGIATSPNDSFYIPVLPERSEIFYRAYSLLTRKDITKVYHNGNFDIEGFRQLSLSLNIPEPDYWNIQDTALLANNCGLPPDLHTLGEVILGDYSLFTIPELLEQARQSTGKKNVTMLDVPLADVAKKCCNDVRTTFRLVDGIRNHVYYNSSVESCYQVDLELTSKLKKLERKGFRLNHKVLVDRINNLRLLAEEYENWGNELGFNISSGKQVGDWLSRVPIVLPLTKGGKQLDTSEEVLEKVNHPVAKNVLGYRSIKKTLSTYCEPNLNETRLYTHFRLDLSTGRLASYGMDCPDHRCSNLQNIPPELRDMFTPDNDIFTSGDMSQAEMRTFAWFTKDPVMKKAYDDGVSIHEVTFRKLYPQLEYNKDIHEYTIAKGFNFAVIFDAGDSELAKRFKVPIRQASALKREWFDLYKVGYNWMEEKKTDSNNTYVEDIYGRKMRLPDAFRGQKHIDTCKINYTIQGSVASINKRALLKILNANDGEDIRLQVHDEFVNDGDYEFDKELDEIYPGLYIPFEVKKGKVWL